MHSLLEKLPKDARAKLRKKRQPSWTAPMLTTLTDDRFSDPNWIFERKLDGERVLVFRNGKRVRLLSRNKKLINNTYPELVDEYQKQPNGSFTSARTERKRAKNFTRKPVKLDWKDSSPRMARANMSTLVRATGSNSSA